jgi:hypothetical protein
MKWMRSDSQKTIPAGASASLVAALSPDVVPCAYYMDCQIEKVRVHEALGNEDIGKKLWEVTDKNMSERVAK